MSARTRRSLTLLWTALFVLSLGLQYMTFAAPPSTLAVHDEGLFELDGNAVNEAPPGDDWDQVYGNSSSADATTFVTDPTDQKLDQIFTGGGSKDDLNVNGGPGTGWKWTIGSVPDKDNITHAYAAAYKTATDTIVYFGLDRLANNGDAFVGFWFFKSGVGPIAAGDFSGQHTVGDLLVLSNFENGGTTATIELYEWVGSGGDTNNTLNKVASGTVCTGAPATDQACAVTNLTEVDSPWPYTPKFGTDGKFPVQSFFEGGINLTDLYDGDPPCFSGFLGETRSSSSVDAVLKDFAIGSFNTCEPPNITTTASAQSINVGESVTDTADFTANSPAVTGSVDFFVCGPTASATACTSGGTKVGATKTISAGTAVSDPFPVSDPTKTGFYCFRAEYTPDQAGSNHYIAGSHTNATTECFQVIPAQVTIVKTTSTPTVSAGSPISFTLSWGNSGPGTATGVVVTDNLPATNGLSWSISGSTGTGSTCSVVANVLTCNVGTIPGNTAVSGTVTLTSNTTPANCGVISNTGRIASTNDGSADSTAEVNVQCPDVTVVKTPDGGTVLAGDPAVFSIVVSNAGLGAAAGVTLSDSLPAGYTWTLGGADAAACSINTASDPDVLSCNFGTLAAGATRTITLTAPTTGANCAVIPNTATVAATNEPANAPLPNSDGASIDVLCGDVVIVKTADAASVNAGDPIGFTVTITNNGAGAANGLVFTDALPAGTGVDWSISPASAGWSISGTPPAETLVYSPTSLAAGASASVHVVSATTKDSCKVYDNTASVTTTNDGSDTASASTTVLCASIDLAKTADAASVITGSQIGFTLTVTNNGAGAAKNVHVADTLPTNPGLAWTIAVPVTGWSIAGGQLIFDAPSLAAGASSSVHVVSPTTRASCGAVNNTGTVTTSNDGSDSASASVTVVCPLLTLEKSNNAPLETIDLGGGVTVSLPTAEEGDTVTFTLVYTLVQGPVTNGVLTDKLPAGITYLPGTATSSVPGAQFTFTGYDSATRTLRWDAATVSANGTVTYKATIDDGAVDLPQPLVNVATIDSAQTEPDSDDSQVFVQEVQAVTSSPSITPPPTDTLAPTTQAPSNPGFALMLVLLGLAGFALTLGFITPVPERIRRRDRRS